MKTKTLQQLKRTMTIAAAALLLAGCTTTGYQQAEKTGAGITEFREEVNRGKQAIDATMQSLGQIAATANTDPRAAFQQYKKDLASLEAITAKVRKRSQEMKAKGDAYFKQWQQQTATVQNPEIRKLSEEQKTKMQATFDTIQQHTEPLKAKFDPWLADLRDLRTYLSNDLTVSGIDAARGLFEKTQSEGTEIQKSMDALVAELNKVSVAMTPSTAPPPNAAPAPSAK
jgi:PBP1b-binding outer membrane lipoprotein LpoB